MVDALHLTVAAELRQKQSVPLILIVPTVKYVTEAVALRLAEPILVAETHFASLLTICPDVRVHWDISEIPELSVIQVIFFFTLLLIISCGYLISYIYYSATNAYYMAML